MYADDQRNTEVGTDANFRLASSDVCQLAAGRQKDHGRIRHNSDMGESVATQLHLTIDSIVAYRCGLRQRGMQGIISHFATTSRR